MQINCFVQGLPFRHTHLSIAAGIKSQTPVQDMTVSQADSYGMAPLLHAKLVRNLTNKTEDTPANTASCASLRVYFVLVTSYLHASADEQLENRQAFQQARKLTRRRSPTVPSPH